MDSFKD